MKNESVFAKKFAAFYKRLKAARAPEPATETDPVTHLVLGFLEWNSTRKAARDAHARLMALMVDNNDLRVSHPHEIVALLGERYPQAEERAMRMHEALQEIFIREHGVGLEDLADKAKKQVWTYLETLPGVPPYVAARAMLLGFGGHAIPVDDRLAELLRQEEVVDPASTVEEITAFLVRHIKAEDALDAHLRLRAWTDSQSSRTAKPAAKTGKSATKPTRKR